MRVPAIAFDLDGPQSSGAYWSTVNANEMLSGISTPLNWSWYGQHNEASMRWAFYNIGALSASDTPVPADPDRRFTEIFYGRAAVNVDMFRDLADRTPGTSGDAVERQFFGSVRPGMSSAPQRRRYPAVAARLPVTATRIRPRLRSALRSTSTWWRSSIRALDGANPADALRILDEAHAKFPKVMNLHLTCTMMTQGFFDQLSQLAARAGCGGLEGVLTTATDVGLEETAVLGQIWDMSRAAGTAASMQAILDRHGFMGPAEISAHSWREDPQPLKALCAHYQELTESDGPAAVRARQRTSRTEAQAKLLGSLPRHVHARARAVLALTDRFMPTRESGRGLMLMPVDVGRAAVRIIGSALSTSGVLSHPDDVFFLTLDELSHAVTASSADLRERVEGRRERRAFYETLELPEAWYGTLDPAVQKHPNDTADGTLSGIGVSDGVYEGRVQVVSDPWVDNLRDGDVLVCSTTDPSWSALFAIAGAVVVDIGGQLSHGAIVAREFGLPCVVNIKNGTKRLATGDRVRVDGHTGTVTKIV